MNLRTFAEQVLFSSRLEDKLAAPTEPIDDFDPGPAILTPTSPGRPESLAFSKEKGNRSEFSKARHLQSDEDRAVLLHFFANHELLATELMALVLLKFPEAPKEFRAGILNTLREEQAHTQMYMRRMASCGLAFGERPVNGFIWRSIASMESPLDYVTRLSLTFEQANLDYARHFAALFKRAGDGSTATILDKIYRDEINHVGYGLKWFRRWKANGETDWHAYQRQLHFPMTPHRAKGKAPFNREGRKQAGLDDEFIRELEVSTSSRGRTPNVYVFNPEAEESVARGDADFTASKDALTLAHDLDTFSLFLAKEDDIVLLRHRPSTAFLSTLQDVGLPLPEIMTLTPDGLIPGNSPILERKIGALRPWGWSPDSVGLFAPMAHNVTRKGAGTFWDENIAGVYSKAWSSRFVRDVVSIEPELPLLAAADCGQVARSAEEVTGTASGYLARGHPNIVLKAAFGMSGRAMIRVNEDDFVSDRTRGWIGNMLHRHGAIIVEPWLDRVLDLSMQYEVSRWPEGPARVIFKGSTRLQNDARGQFRSCTVGQRFIEQLPPEIGLFLNSHPARQGWARILFEDAIPALLEGALKTSPYEGPLGIDAFVFRDGAGALRLQPIVEVNPRFTVGRVAVELGRHLEPGSRGTLEIIPAAEFVVQPSVETVAHGHHKKIRQGSLALTEPDASRRFAAIWNVVASDSCP
jgi:uncharacterized ferritin-like protein (DUF455 family)